MISKWKSSVLLGLCTYFWIWRSLWGLARAALLWQARYKDVSMCTWRVRTPGLKVTRYQLQDQWTPAQFTAEKCSWKVLRSSLVAEVVLNSRRGIFWVNNKGYLILLGIIVCKQPGFYVSYNFSVFWNFRNQQKNVY